MGSRPKPTRYARDERLSREEEVELAQRTAAGDRKAARRLIRAHRRFIVHMARRHQRHGVPLADLLQEGTIGLLEAVRRFNPERDTRLSTYAVWWIRAAIQDHIVKSGPILRQSSTGALRRQLFGARRGTAEPSDVSAPENPPPAIEELVCNRPTPEERLLVMREWAHRFTGLPAALKRLAPRERLIIARRFLSEPARSRSAIGRELGLSKERVRQLELRALSQLRTVLT